MRVAPDLRPRTVGEVLDAGFFVYRRYFGRLLLVATIVSIPTLVVAGLIAEASTEAIGDYFLWAMDSAQKPGLDLAEYMAEWSAQVQRLNFYSTISYLVQEVARGGAYATMALAAAAAVRRSPMPGVMALVKGGLPRVAAVILSQIVAGILSSMAFCCLPAMVVVLVLVLPLPAVIMLERGRLETALRDHIAGDPAAGRGPLPATVSLPLRWFALPGAMVIDGFVRSMSLSWHVVTVARGTVFVSFLFLFKAFFVGAAAISVAALLREYAAVFWLQHYAEVVVLPVLGLGTTFWYFDLRTRREGLDLLAEPEPAL